MAQTQKHEQTKSNFSGLSERTVDKVSQKEKNKQGSLHKVKNPYKKKTTNTYFGD